MDEIMKGFNSWTDVIDYVLELDKEVLDRDRWVSKVS